MSQTNRQCNLRIVSLVHCDTRRFPAHRVATVGTDNELCLQCTVAAKQDGGAVAIRRDPGYRVLDEPELGQGANTLLERNDQMTILDVVAKGVQVNFSCAEFNLRCAPQPAGIVYNAHHFEGRSLRGAGLPDPKCLKRGDGTCQQCGRAVVGPGRLPAYDNG